MSSYQVTDYLLDRANIHDVVTKLYMYVDMRDWDKFATEVPADEVVLDYSRMFGGEPSKHSPRTLVEAWKPLLEGLSSTQHTTAYATLSLGRPGSVEKPAEATVYGNVMASLNKGDAMNGQSTANGGRFEIEVVKVSKGGDSGNPWRISLLRAFPAWSVGEKDVLTSATSE